MTVAIKLFPDTYVDSVVQLRGMRAMRQVGGVEWASAAMATPANVETLRAEGLDPMQVADAGANDFFLVVRATTDSIAAEALAAGESAVTSTVRSYSAAAQIEARRSLRDAVLAQPESNVAVISVPGDYAALAAHQALSADLHVLLFSDNVPVDKEVALKDHALSRGRLLMGPGAGTAMLGGVGLGFANTVRPGPVGVVAAAGTGAQEAMALLDRWGVGVSQVIGVGGRDLSPEVGGRMAGAAVSALRDDPATEVILFVSKPPSPEVAATVLATAGDKPLVAALLGLDPQFPAPAGVVLADTLESGVTATLGVLGIAAPDTTATIGPTLAEVRSRLAPGRRLIRGLFSGGTLCYESLVILGRTVGEVHSNTPINQAWGLPAPAESHQCLDLGEEEYTRGRPHPMIDPEARLEVLSEHAADPQVAVIILDVVLGHGADADPAKTLAPACQSAMADGGPQVVAYVLGTDQDPQGYQGQRDRLVQAGCILTETAARASLVAAAIVTDDPSLTRMAL
ncbi:protein FdrA [Nocardioides agariphilus]|jgi:FdrA protein|uniref:Protein FdrA n=1 Tax=Nocardioides agariphilus TaxID=433664 RepID=A0A930VPB5_9ACTN|nr:protein FdrA [Nocardioides agariphilus]MBF4770433.1 protein FdrA [Nocardioides agariphilus]